MIVNRLRIRPGMRRVGAVTVCSLLVSACGSTHNPSSPTAPAGQLVSPQAALSGLAQTGIPRLVVAISYQIDQAPTMCSVLPLVGHAGMFTLLIAWLPTNPNSNFAAIRESVLQATIGPSPDDDHFHVNSFGGQTPEPASVQASIARVALSNPQRCQALANGDLRLTSSS